MGEQVRLQAEKGEPKLAGGGRLKTFKAILGGTFTGGEGFNRRGEQGVEIVYEN